MVVHGTRGEPGEIELATMGVELNGPRRVRDAVWTLERGVRHRELCYLVTSLKGSGTIIRERRPIRFRSAPRTC